MPEALRDPIWQFIGALLAFSAIVISILLYWMQRRRKVLSYEIVSRTPLLSVEEEVKGKLQILFDGSPVQDVHLVIIKVMNSGNMPIVSADYERQVRIAFGENTRILTAEVSETSPDNLEASVSLESKAVVLAPILLNSGDSITVKMLVSQFDREISVDGRIVGVKTIKRAGEGRVQYYILTMGGMVLTLVGTIVLTRSSPPPPPDQPSLSERLPEILPFLLLVFLGYAMMLIGMLRYSRFRRVLRSLFS